MTDVAARFLSVSKMWKMIFKFALIVGCAFSLVPVVVFAQQPAAKNKTSQESASLQKLAEDFWQWRARFQPFTSDDIPRIDRPSGPRDWSAASIAEQRTALATFEKRWKGLDPSGRSVTNQVDYRLIGSALARVRWELDINPRWQRDPSFYVDQTLAALTEALLQPPPFDAQRSGVIVERIEQIPGILENAKANLHPFRPFAELAIESLDQIRPKLLRVEQGVTPMLHGGSTANDTGAARFQAATEKAIAALELYRAWLQQNLNTMPENAAVGPAAYEFFLRNVALLPYTPEQLLFMSRQEWDRAVAFETLEKQKNRVLPELKMAADADEEISRVTRDEAAIRRFLDANDILTVPAGTPRYTMKLIPDYLDALSDFTEMDDFTSVSRTNDLGIRWINQPSPSLGYFWLASTKDARPDLVHEGIPGHFFQMSLSRRHPDPIRRQYYDSGANEGIGFYAEEMMLQAGLFDDNPRTREVIYNFMRLRALRVEVDVKLALGIFTMNQAADYLAQYVPMDKRTAHSEAATFSTTPGQAITYLVGKTQILAFLADARLAQGENFNLRNFDDFLWLNGNIPIVLQRWEYLGKDDDLRTLDGGTTVRPSSNQPDAQSNGKTP
jgi:uncharacterized protein DUF885